MSSIPPDRRGRGPFVQAAYVDGRLFTAILDCPFGHPGEHCHVVQHDRRRRKTGPTHDLVVLRCVIHEHSFTVYPLGFVPYSRRQLVKGAAQHGVPSLVEVVEETAAHGPVDREPTGGPEGSWSSQNRLLDRAARLFGLDAIGSVRERVAVLTGLPLVVLEAAARARGVQRRAAALLRLLHGLDADVLLGLGALAGLWGTPHRWSAHREQLLPVGPSP